MIMKFVSILLLVITCTNGDIFPLNKNPNVSYTETHNHRQKRFLVYNYGGGSKIVFGMLVPIAIPKWQSINWAVNLQANYGVPTTVIHWIDRWKSRELTLRKERELEKNGDGSREIAYSIVENLINRHGKNGRACLMKSICEAAQTPLSGNTLYDELFHIFFTPGDDIGHDYKDAMIAGHNYANCNKLFSDCSDDFSLLSSISLIEENLMDYY